MCSECKYFEFYEEDEDFGFCSFWKNEEYCLSDCDKFVSCEDWED